MVTLHERGSMEQMDEDDAGKFWWIIILCLKLAAIKIYEVLKNSYITIYLNPVFWSMNIKNAIFVPRDIIYLNRRQLLIDYTSEFQPRYD